MSFLGAMVRKALLWMKKPKDVLCSRAGAFSAKHEPRLGCRGL